MDEQIMEDFKNFKILSNFGKKMEKCIQGMTRPMEKWINEVEFVFDKDAYLKREERYVYYKKKICDLVEDVESKVVQSETVWLNDVKRIERVIFFFLKIF